MEVETRTVSKGARIANGVKLCAIVLNHYMTGMVWVNAWLRDAKVKTMN